MIILAFDLATNVGIAVGDAHGKPRLMSENLGEASENSTARFSRVLDLANTLVREHKPGLIAIEKPIVSGPVGKSSRALLTVGLRGCVMGVAGLRRVPVMEKDVGAIRAYFLGKGRWSAGEGKGAVFDKCVKIGWGPKNDDESDAAALWDFARHIKVGYGTLPIGLLGGREMRR